jgi:hypothetical protein
MRTSETDAYPKFSLCRPNVSFAPDLLQIGPLTESLIYSVC